MVRLLLKYGASLTAEDKKQKIAAIHITADKGFLRTYSAQVLLIHFTRFLSFRISRLHTLFPVYFSYYLSRQPS
jgi:hypothetical protein